MIADAGVPEISTAPEIPHPAGNAEFLQQQVISINNQFTPPSGPIWPLIEKNSSQMCGYSEWGVAALRHPHQLMDRGSQSSQHGIQLREGMQSTDFRFRLAKIHIHTVAQGRAVIFDITRTGRFVF